MVGFYLDMQGKNNFKIKNIVMGIRLLLGYINLLNFYLNISNVSVALLSK